MTCFSAFTHCCKESGFTMVFKCREENAALKDCLIKQYVFIKMYTSDVFFDFNPCNVLQLSRSSLF